MNVIWSSLRWLSSIGRRIRKEFDGQPLGRLHPGRELEDLLADLPFDTLAGEHGRIRKDRFTLFTVPPGSSQRCSSRQSLFGRSLRSRRHLNGRGTTSSRAAPARPLKGRHVVILVENLPVPFDRRPWQIARTLVESGYRVSVICPQMYEYVQKQEHLQGVDVYRYPSCEGSTPRGWVCEYCNALFWMSWMCLKLHLTRGIDAIHACNPPDLLFLVAWPYRVFCGVRFLFDHHDLGPEIYMAKFGRRDLVYRIMCAMERMTYRLADVALATNVSFRQIAMHRDGKRPDRIHVVRNAPMPGHLIEGHPRPELKWGRQHLVVYLGVMNKQDGLDLLLESICDLVHGRGRSDVLFALIGDGPELPRLRERAAQLDIDGQVRFLGRISDSRLLSDYLNTASICVCPDPKNDMNDRSTMTKVVEYMALGRPIVAYDLRETVYSAGDAALYAANNDPRHFADLLVELLDDHERRQQMGRYGKARYDAILCWDRSRKRLLEAYNRLFQPTDGLRPASGRPIKRDSGGWPVRDRLCDVHRKQRLGS